MTSLLASLLPLSFFFVGDSMFGITTTGISFSQITVLESPRVQEFRIGDEHWYVCEEGIIETLKDLSVCVSEEVIN